ncbi:MAG: type I methionyl aminopeptidase [Myxococcales bacterium]|nr:type I methionyl aminopeptidase [Myxococcales bacterium]
MRQKRRSRIKRRNDRPQLTPEKLEGLRVAGRFAAEILDRVAEMIAPGISTGDIDNLVLEMSNARGARCAPKGYRGFPKHCCTSINEVVCHGIPSDAQRLQEGDIINVDVTPILDGFYGDTSRTFAVGEISDEARRLIDDTYEAMWRGIYAVKAGGHVGDIGRAIQPFAEARGYSVVREFTGHGTGETFHCPPTITHHVTLGRGEPILSGMVFTIEPMINLGRWKTRILDDGWTAITVDRKLSAQWEHTIAVTDEGIEILTLGASETPPPRPE